MNLYEFNFLVGLLKCLSHGILELDVPKDEPLYAALFSETLTFIWLFSNIFPPDVEPEILSHPRQTLRCSRREEVAGELVDRC